MWKINEQFRKTQHPAAEESWAGSGSAAAASIPPALLVPSPPHHSLCSGSFIHVPVQPSWAGVGRAAQDHGGALLNLSSFTAGSMKSVSAALVWSWESGLCCAHTHKMRRCKKSPGRAGSKQRSVRKPWAVAHESCVCVLKVVQIYSIF